jgi:hypothetical protein
MKGWELVLGFCLVLKKKKLDNLPCSIHWSGQKEQPEVPNERKKQVLGLGGTWGVMSYK